MSKRKQQQPKLERRVGNRESVDLSNYQRTKSAAGNASLDCGDEMARKLRGMELPAIYKLAAKALGESERGLRKRYAHLNVGMQRMTLGNRLRATK